MTRFGVLSRIWWRFGVVMLFLVGGSPGVHAAIVFPDAVKQGDVATTAELNNRFTSDAIAYEAGFVPEITTAMLGEEIMISFIVRNTGHKPIMLFVGGDGRGIRPIRFQISAVDSAGKPVADPYPDADRYFHGGIGGPVGIQPGLAHSEQMPVSKWCAFTTPGVYTVTCRATPEIFAGIKEFGKIDRPKPGRNQVATSFTLTFVQPTGRDVQRIIEARRLDSGPYQTNTGMSTLRAPMFLEPVLELARGGDQDAIKAIGGMENPKATRELIGLAWENLKTRPEIALAALDEIMPRLPSPAYYAEEPDYKTGKTTGKLNAYSEPDRQRVARTWTPDMAPAMREMARVLAKNTDKHSLDLAGRILWYIGTADDMPAALEGYTRAIEATKTLPFETHQYFRPRGAAYVYRFTIQRLYELGATMPTNPSTPGECAAYLLALNKNKDFRPEDWPAQVELMLGTDIPYMRELALDFVPEPVPEPILARLPEFLNDPYVDLQISAAKMAKKHPRAEYKGPLLKILTAGKEKYLLDFAAEAAPANGIPIDHVMDIWVGRLSPDDLGEAAAVRLLVAALDGSIQSSRELKAAEAEAARQIWTRFIEKNRDKLRSGRRFKPTDPEFEPGLFPPGFSFYFDKQPWP